MTILTREAFIDRNKTFPWWERWIWYDEFDKGRCDLYPLYI